MQWTSYIGIPLAVEKVDGPLDYLGITLDTNKMEAQLPDGKLTAIYQPDFTIEKPRKKREILSLLGSLYGMSIK